MPSLNEPFPFLTKYVSTVDFFQPAAAANSASAQPWEAVLKRKQYARHSGASRPATCSLHCLVERGWSTAGNRPSCSSPASATASAPQHTLNVASSLYTQTGISGMLRSPVAGPRATRGAVWACGHHVGRVLSSPSSAARALDEEAPSEPQHVQEISPNHRPNQLASAPRKLRERFSLRH